MVGFVRLAQLVRAARFNTLVTMEVQPLHLTLASDREVVKKKPDVIK